MISQVLGLLFGGKKDESSDCEPAETSVPTKRRRGRPPIQDRSRLSLTIPHQESQAAGAYSATPMSATDASCGSDGIDTAERRKRGRPQGASHRKSLGPHLSLQHTSGMSGHSNHSSMHNFEAPPSNSHSQHPSAQQFNSQLLGFYRRSRRYRPPDPHKELIVLMPGDDAAEVLGIPAHERDEFLVSFNEPLDYEESEDDHGHGDGHASANSLGSLLLAGRQQQLGGSGTSHGGSDNNSWGPYDSGSGICTGGPSAIDIALLEVLTPRVREIQPPLQQLTKSTGSCTGGGYSVYDQEQELDPADEPSRKKHSRNSKVAFSLPPVGEAIPGYKYTEYDVDSDDEQFLASLGPDTADRAARLQPSAEHFKHIVCFLERELFESNALAPLVDQTMRLHAACTSFADETHGVLRSVQDLFQVPEDGHGSEVDVNINSSGGSNVNGTISLLDQPASAFSLSRLKLDNLLNPGSSRSNNNYSSSNSNNNSSDRTVDRTGSGTDFGKSTSDVNTHVTSSHSNNFDGKSSSSNSINNNNMAVTDISAARIALRVPFDSVSAALYQIYIVVSAQRVGKSFSSYTALLQNHQAKRLFISQSVLEPQLRKIYDYWVAKRSVRSVSLLRCYHEFIMENWQQQATMPKLLSEDDDLSGLLLAQEQLCTIRRDLDRSRLIVDRVRRREKIKRELLRIAGESCEQYLVELENANVKANAKAANTSVNANNKKAASSSSSSSSSSVPPASSSSTATAIIGERLGSGSSRAAKAGAIQKMTAIHNIEHPMMVLMAEKESKPSQDAGTAAHSTNNITSHSHNSRDRDRDRNRDSDRSKDSSRSHSKAATKELAGEQFDEPDNCRFLPFEVECLPYPESVALPLVPATVQAAVTAIAPSKVTATAATSAALPSRSHKKRGRPTKPADDEEEEEEEEEEDDSDVADSDDEDNEDEEDDEDDEEEEEEEEDDDDSSEDGEDASGQYKSSFCNWEPDEDKLLLMGVAACGLGRWSDIREYFGLLRNSAQMNQRFTRLARRRVNATAGSGDSNVVSDLSTSRRQSADMRSLLPAATLKQLNRFNEKEVWRHIVLRHMFDQHTQEKRSGRPVKSPLQLPAPPKEFRNRGFLKFEHLLPKLPPPISQQSNPVSMPNGQRARYINEVRKAFAKQHASATSAAAAAAANNKSKHKNSQTTPVATKSGRLLTAAISAVKSSEAAAALLRTKDKKKAANMHAASSSSYNKVVSKVSGSHSRKKPPRKRGRPRKDGSQR